MLHVQHNRLESSHFEVKRKFLTSENLKILLSVANYYLEKWNVRISLKRRAHTLIWGLGFGQHLIFFTSPKTKKSKKYFGGNHRCDLGCFARDPRARVPPVKAI
jgi:hypothetical protein